jgi:hypothetical protein
MKQNQQYVIPRNKNSYTINKNDKTHENHIDFGWAMVCSEAFYTKAYQGYKKDPADHLRLEVHLINRAGRDSNVFPASCRLNPL